MLLLRLAITWGVFSLVGCAMTREVQKRPGRGGVVMVKEGLIGDARKDADDIMSRNCGGKRVVIVSEGEAVVGSKTSSDTDSYDGGSSTSSTSKDIAEWRIKYRCGGKGGGKGKKKRKRRKS